MRDRIKVGGKIGFNFGSVITDQTDKTACIINNLISYLRCFFDSNVFGDSKKSIATIKDMLLTAYVTDDHQSITLIFPEEIRERFLLKESYTISLTHHAILAFYCNSLCKKSHLTCNIVLNTEDDDANRDTIIRLRHMLLRATKRIKKITIGRNKKTCQYDFRIVFVKGSHPAVRDSAADIDNAIAAIASHII